MFNDILGCMTIGGTFFVAGFIGAVWDFKRAQRKKIAQQKIKALNDALDEGVEEVMQEGVNSSSSQTLALRKRLEHGRRIEEVKGENK